MDGLLFFLLVTCLFVVVMVVLVDSLGIWSTFFPGGISWKCGIVPIMACHPREADVLFLCLKLGLLPCLGVVKKLT